MRLSVPSQLYINRFEFKELVSEFQNVKRYINKKLDLQPTTTLKHPPLWKILERSSP